ncbi:hypothetical protein I4F81_000597 [Pyropia yezoensis]|uniref:Uncharacterized protein n=1 Tax=Pyropia yezoensis TaxID=2788 RepID=A0ACC3BK50_PYRYE|nr:hypothetical protein I4F81_000597 [Neopyropia yezoensis]
MASPPPPPSPPPAHAAFPSAAVYTSPLFLAAATAARAAAAGAGAPPGESKESVDRPLRAPPSEVLAALAAAPSVEAAAAALSSTLQAPALAKDIVPCAPPAEGARAGDGDGDNRNGGGGDGADGGDVAPPVPRSPPAHLPVTAAALFTDLGGRWRRLCRRTADAVVAAPAAHSSLPLPRPFFVPGGRFREVYYWDSLWILHGLLASGMPAAARAVVDNWLHLVRVVGHAPNGGRVYYLGRSQPPVLAEMVWAVVWAAATAAAARGVGEGRGGHPDALGGDGGGGGGGGVDARGDWGGADPDVAAMAAALSAADVEWLRAALPVLDTEYNWFMRHRAVRLVVAPPGAAGGPPPRLVADDETAAAVAAATPGASVVTLNAYGAQGGAAVAAATAAAAPRPESYPTDTALGVELLRQLRAAAAPEGGAEAGGGGGGTRPPRPPRPPASGSCTGMWWPARRAGGTLAPAGCRRRSPGGGRAGAAAPPLRLLGPRPHPTGRRTWA